MLLKHLVCQTFLERGPIEADPSNAFQLSTKYFSRH